MKTTILGVHVDAITRQEAEEKLLSFFEKEKPCTVFTPNPEIILLAGQDKEFMQILNNGDMVIPDGIGVVYASRLNSVKIKERVAGYDLIESVFDRIKDSEKTVYFLGGAPGVAEKARENMQKKYPGLKIVGVNDGYFDEKREKIIINEIKQKKPDLLLVGMSMGKQEKWITKHKNRLGAKVLVGVGGSLDGYSGVVKRAPVAFQRLGLEWFYRLLRQPSRIKRQIQLPIFIGKVILDKLKK